MDPKLAALLRTEALVKLLRVVAVLAGILWVVSAAQSVWSTMELLSDEEMMDSYGPVFVGGGAASSEVPDFLLVVSAAASPALVLGVAVLALFAVAYLDIRCAGLRIELGLVGDEGGTDGQGAPGAA